jgi:hypothetical protein
VPTAANTRYGVDVDDTTGLAHIPTAAQTEYGVDVDQTTGLVHIPAANDTRKDVAVNQTVGNVIIPDVAEVKAGTVFDINSVGVMATSTATYEAKGMFAVDFNADFIGTMWLDTSNQFTGTDLVSASYQVYGPDGAAILAFAESGIEPNASGIFVITPVSMSGYEAVSFFTIGISITTSDQTVSSMQTVKLLDAQTNITLDDISVGVSGVWTSEISTGVTYQEAIQGIIDDIDGLGTPDNTEVLTAISGVGDNVDDCLAKIGEVHTLAGLDAASPMTVTPTSRVAGDIELAISGDGITTTTVTRST